MTATRRKSSMMAQERMQAQLAVQSDDVIGVKAKGNGRSLEIDSPRSSSKRQDDDEFVLHTEDRLEDESTVEGPTKKRRVAQKGSKEAASSMHAMLFGDASEGAIKHASIPPRRQHSIRYHRPLLLDGSQGRESRANLLAWFDANSSARGMPWRKSWLDPSEHDRDAKLFREMLAKRAYEVWISEIMLQQTRVAVVIEYYNKWMKKWPTINDLASASSEDVLSAWAGLGYYSRATRIHEAAKKVVQDENMQGLLPQTAQALESSVPGVGRYTGGAISAIVFGHAAPMVDGNVLRVLSRQLGILSNVKTNKNVIDTLWAAADGLVKAVALDGVKSGKVVGVSDRPGRWGQALMELGSTVCTPKPNCASCPVTLTCRAFAEGQLLADARRSNGDTQPDKVRADAVEKTIPDLEDLCSLCDAYEEVAEENGEEDHDEPLKASKSESGHLAKDEIGKAKAKQATLSSFSFTKKSSKVAQKDDSASSMPDSKALDIIVDHAKRFPVKVTKKSVRQEETLVCAIRRSDGRFLIQQRPKKGLLAGMWELPSDILPDTNDSTAANRKKRAIAFVDGLLANQSQSPSLSSSNGGLKRVGEVGSVPWLFSHLKLTMHVQSFRLDTDKKDFKLLDSTAANCRWATMKEIEEESMGTGMRKCCTLVKEALSV